MNYCDKNVEKECYYLSDLQQHLQFFGYDLGGSTLVYAYKKEPRLESVGVLRCDA